MQPLTKQTFLIFWQHARRYKALLFVTLLGLTTTSALELVQPFLYKLLFDTMARNDINLLPDLQRIVLLFGVMYCAGWIAWRILSFANIRFQSNVMADLLDTCFEYVHKHSYGYFADNFVGSIVAKMRRYPKSFEAVADQVYFDLGRTLILRVGLVTLVLCIYSWQIGLLMVGWVILFVGFNFFFSRYKLKYDLERSNMDTEITAQVADSITNNINVKLFASLNREKSIFTKITDRWQRTIQKAWDLSAISEAIQGAMMIALEVGILAIGVHFWSTGKFTVGDLALLQGYMWQIFENLWNLGRNFRNLYEAIADANEMTEILTTSHGVPDAVNATPIQITKGEIEFKDVSFRYKNNNEIFSHFNLHIPAGQKVALVGVSGGGKSTIAKLLFRFYDVTGGILTVDGQDISKAVQDSLRSQIALVPQDPILFHRPIMENIRYGRPNATDEEVMEAAKLAHCHEFIQSFNDGYQTLVGERGVKLSGGERQRVAIARAILKRAPILVLDEATSSLDSESEYYIQDALKNLMRGKTTIVIAHRLSTIMQMDRILVLQGGKIIEEGKHEELVKATSGTYQKLWNIQAGGFEAAQSSV